MLAAIPPLALGVSSDSAARQSIAKGARSKGSILTADLDAVILERGIHVVTANMTIKADIMALPGAIIDIAAGKTLTLLGDFQAPIARVFSGSGAVDMMRSRAEAVYPEYWGAVRDNSAIDSLSALEASVAAHQNVRLGAGDYYISQTWHITQSHRRIWGAGNYWKGPNQGTRIIVTNGRDDVMRVGTLRPPPSINAYVQSVDIRWLELGRSAVPEAGSNSATGLSLHHVLFCHFEGLSSSEHSIGFAIAGAVRTHVCNCFAFRSLPASSAIGSNEARFWGFYFDGRKDIGLAGGNASVFLMDCNASIGGDPALDDAVGAYLDGAFADSFLTNFETSGLSVGIRIDGKADQLKGRQRKSGHANVHILTPVIDGFTGIGIEIRNVSPYGMIDIVDPYLGLGSGAFCGVLYQDCAGLTSITAGQIIGWYNYDRGGDALGIYAIDCTGLGVEGTKVLGFRRPVGIERCVNFTMNVTIHNPEQRASQAALWVEDCSFGNITARISGQTAAYPAGIALRGVNNHLSINANAIMLDCINDGANNRIQKNRETSTRISRHIIITGL